MAFRVGLLAISPHGTQNSWNGDSECNGLIASTISYNLGSA
jgi:hypothetical protein